MNGADNRMIQQNFRSLLVYASVISSIFMLIWMLSEQEKVRVCTEKLTTTSSDDKSKVIIIQQPAVNQTQNNDKNKEDLWDLNWDKKAWKDPREAEGVPTRTIILVRHGQYDFNTGKLTPLGHQQARLTGSRLRQMYIKYQEIIHSTMERAVETASNIHQSLPNVSTYSDAFIREGGPIPPDPTITYWSLSDREYYVDGPRLEAAFRQHFYRADKSQPETTRHILVGHANIFRFFILRALQFPKAAWMRFFIAHGSITVIHLHADGTVALDKMGDSGHLPVNMVTY